MSLRVVGHRIVTRCQLAVQTDERGGRLTEAQFHQPYIHWMNLLTQVVLAIMATSGVIVATAVAVVVMMAAVTVCCVTSRGHIYTCRRRRRAG